MNYNHLYDPLDDEEPPVKLVSCKICNDDAYLNKFERLPGIFEYWVSCADPNCPNHSNTPRFPDEYDAVSDWNEARVLYVVDMLRFNSTEKHHYCLGLFTDRRRAERIAESEERYRGGKYTARIYEMIPDTEYYKMDGPVPATYALFGKTWGVWE